MSIVPIEKQIASQKLPAGTVKNSQYEDKLFEISFEHYI